MFTKLFKMHYSGLGRGYLHSDYLNKTAMLIRSSLQILVFALLKTLAGEEGQPVGDMSVRKCTELQHQKMANGCSLPHHTPCQLWTCSAMQGSKILEKRNCHRREENKQTKKLQKNNPKEEFWKKTFSPARIQASSLQLALFTSSNSNSKCFKVLLHFFSLKIKMTTTETKLGMRKPEDWNNY